MKIALLNASPKVGNSTSNMLLQSLKTYFQENSTLELHWNVGDYQKQKRDKNYQDKIFEQIISCDAVVFAFPLYVDAEPSHLLHFLVNLETYMKENGQSALKYVYAIVNNGFFDPKQNRPAVEVIENWSIHCHLQFGQGVCVGGGGMLSSLTNVPEGRGPKKNISNALEELANCIQIKDTRETKYVLPNYPELMYKIQAQMGWRFSAKKNGLKTKDLFRRASIE